MQVTPTKLLLLTLEGKLITKHDMVDSKIISVGAYLGCSDLIFVLKEDGEVTCYNASTV